MSTEVRPAFGQMRIPDILETIADLSNDEVFTPPDLANKVLDMLPESIWTDSSVTFLDPATKTGVFLREITKRLIKGLEHEFPDLQERVNHILTKQVYGLGITKLTSLMSRRTVYCSTTANGIKSVCTEFDDIDGNIKFPNSKHTFNKNGKCTVCGAGEDLYYEEEGLDNYAYSFLHDNLKEVFGNVKFDVIIGNPPYQLSDGGVSGNSSMGNALYHLFIDKAIELNPKYLSMIVPSRWMTKNAAGISDEWVDKFKSDKRIKIIHDYKDSDRLFNNVGVMGGVNYFLWDKEHYGDCLFYEHNGNEVNRYSGPLNMKSNEILRDLKSIPIVNKIENVEGKYIDKRDFSSIVSPGGFFSKKDKLRSNWKDFSKERSDVYNTLYYLSKSINGIELAYIKEKDVEKTRSL